MKYLQNVSRRRRRAFIPALFMLLQNNLRERMTDRLKVKMTDKQQRLRRRRPFVARGRTNYSYNAPL